MWLTLFDEPDIVEWTLPRSSKVETGVDRYSALCAKRRTALARAKARCADWVAAWPEMKAIATAWLTHLSKLDDSHVALETYELFGQCSSEREWKKELSRLLRAAAKPRSKAFLDLLGHGAIRVEKAKLLSDDTLGACLACQGNKLPWVELDVAAADPGEALNPMMKTLLGVIAKGLEAKATARKPYSFLVLFTSYKQTSTSVTWLSEWKKDMDFSAEQKATLSFESHPWGRQTPSKLLRFKQADIDALAEAVGALDRLRSSPHTPHLTVVAQSTGDNDRKARVRVPS